MPPSYAPQFRAMVIEQVRNGRRVADVAALAVEATGGGVVRGPYDDARERRAVIYDNKGNGLLFYSRLGR